MGKIRLNIPNKNAKIVNVKGIEYTVPKITLYHRKYFKNVDELKNENIYNIINPVVKKIFRVTDDFTTDVFEFLLIKLFEHNNLLYHSKVIGGEVFKLSDIVIKQKSNFVHDGLEYNFRQPMVNADYASLLDGMNYLQIDTDLDFNEMEVIFYKFAILLFGTVEIVGDKGNRIRGINNILDEFINEEEFEKYRSM